MAPFPAIAPNTRSYDLVGDIPMLAEPAWPGVEVRYLTGSDPLTVTDQPLELGYLSLSSAQAQQLRDHYDEQQGGLIPFSLPAVILQGHSTAITTAGATWRYAGPPSEQQRSGGRVDMVITLESTDYTAIEA